MNTNIESWRKFYNGWTKKELLDFLIEKIEIEIDKKYYEVIYKKKTKKDLIDVLISKSTTEGTVK